MGLSLKTRRKLKELTFKLPPTVKYSKTRTRRKRTEQFALMKIKRGCDKCGYNTCALALHFHHRELPRRTKNQQKGLVIPYINSEQRESVAQNGAQTPGELNYAITKLLIRYWKREFQQSYTTINDILGALEGAKLEFQRRVVTPYEETKIKENGDVYNPS